jgi:hypothetical protein
MTSEYSLSDNSTKFKIILLELIETWFDLTSRNQYKQAEKICADFIIEYGSAFKNLTFNVVGDEYNLLFISLIFVKGLQDYNHLLVITENIDWCQNSSTVERSWIKLCDCRERIEYSSQCFKGQAVEEIIKKLDDLGGFFPNAFEENNYISSGIIVDRYLCNICNEDVRACCHVNGNLYGGNICSYKPINSRFDHVALVKVPRDPRCRIWPWNIQYDDNGKVTRLINIPIIMSGGISDFLDVA